MGMAGHPSAVRVLVGREDELTTLRAGLDAACSGRPNLALVVGPAGIGKTRLVDEAAFIARADGLRVLRGEADASWREPMELWRGVCRSLGVEGVSDALLPAEERRWEHLESLTDALMSCAPALVVLEDLHWADPIALWVLDHLPRALGDAPVALLATSREDEPDMSRLDGVRRVARVVTLGGLDLDAVAELAAFEATGFVDAVALHARTGGHPLFVQELIRSPDSSGVIDEVLDRSLDRFDDGTRGLLGAAAVAGSGTPLAVLAIAMSCTIAMAAERLEPAAHAGVLTEVASSGVRFHHALLAEAAARRTDAGELHERLAAAWDTVGTLDARAAAAGHRLRAAAGTPAVPQAVETACQVAGDLVAAGQHERAVGLLRDARDFGAECPDRPALRATVALELAKVLRGLGDLEPALELYMEAAELARESADPIVRARAEVGANLWSAAFVPDPARVRRLQDTLDALPQAEVRLRARLLTRLAVVGGADADADERVRAWADEAVALARATGDPVLLAQTLINQTMSPSTRAELDARIAAADEVVRLAEHAGRPDLALYGHQRRVSHYLNHGDLGAANRSLSRAELLAELLPGPGWRQRTLVQRTTLLALTGNRSAAAGAMDEAARVGAGHIEPVVLIGCETMHRLMLLDLYGHPDPKTQESFRVTAEMVGDLPSPVLQVQKGFGAQLLGDESMVQEVLHRYAGSPDRILRSMTGDHLLRVLGDIVARAGAATFAEPVYRALLPYAGLLNVGGGQCAGLPVDDVLGRLAALRGDLPAAMRHARAAVTLARSMPSPPLLVHCLDHLADAIERTGTGAGEDTGALRLEADALAAEAGVARPGRERSTPDEPRDVTRMAAIRRNGWQWVLTSPLGEARLRASNGLGQLARLLATPGVEVAAIELATGADTPVARDLGPSLDARAKRAYRQRLLDLQAEVDDAEAANDAVRGERAHVEMDALLRELKRTVGLGGRDRPTGSGAERARVNVARSLRRAIAAVADQAPLLAEHLEESVRTGGYCIYLPGPAALSWTVQTADEP
jgi:tetratricopeptide (TPR) repeat protein